MTKILFYSFCLILSVSTLSAQNLTKAFDLHSPANNSQVVIEGSESDIIPFVWTSARNGNPTGTVYDYTISFDTAGGSPGASPLFSVSNACCQSYYNDTVFNYTVERWASHLNSIFKQKFNRDMAVGESITLDWQVDVMAIRSGPNNNYESNTSTSVFTVTFVRGQIQEEYVPYDLKFPADNQYINLEGNPNTKVNFSWESAYCPAGCNAPDYYLLLDTINGDFENPYLSIAVPLQDSSWNLPYNTLNQILKDAGVPIGGSKLVYWKAMAIGNSQVLYSTETRQLGLVRKLLDNENYPFNLINPTNATTLSLKGNGTISFNFKWESTYTPVSNNSRYFLAFDTVFASPLFSSPIMQFQTPNGSTDTAINVTIGELNHRLDSVYGDGWGSVNLMWAGKAQVDGSFFYPEEPFTITLIEGLILNTKKIKSTEVSLYPNPSSDHFRLQTDGLAGVIELTDLSGKVMLKQSFENDAHLNVVHLPSGIYMAVIHADNEHFVKRIVIQH